MALRHIVMVTTFLEHSCVKHQKHTTENIQKHCEAPFIITAVTEYSNKTTGIQWDMFCYNLHFANRKVRCRSSDKLALNHVCE